jgi:hypothetical protein
MVTKRYIETNMPRFASDPPGFARVGRSLKVPPIAGFRMKPVHRFRRELVGAYTRGAYITTISTEHTRWSVGIGMATTPADSKAFIRTLSVQHCMWDTTTSNGIVLEGNPIYPQFVPERNMTAPVYYSEGTPETQDWAWKIMQVIVQLLQFKAGLNGNLVRHEREVQAMFSDGTIDRAIMETLEGNHIEFLDGIHPDSIELVDDLDFEIGVGIPIDWDSPPQAAIADAASWVHGSQDIFKLKEEFDVLDLLGLVKFSLHLMKEAHHLKDEVVDRLKASGQFDPGDLWEQISLGEKWDAGAKFKTLVGSNYLAHFDFEEIDLPPDRGGSHDRFKAYRSHGRMMLFPYVSDFCSSDEMG